ncbi:hypothetical protein ERY430_80273 [Erythrobacter sp. EC-HK427]|nr:hypothetical protein ERY430_80273 [Erythrobacter sp. EC-HK427]
MNGKFTIALYGSMKVYIPCPASPPNLSEMFTKLREMGVCIGEVAFVISPLWEETRDSG